MGTSVIPLLTTASSLPKLQEGQTPVELKALAHIAIWERADFSLAIYYLRLLLFRSSFAERSDRSKKHMAKTIWTSIISKVTEDSERPLSRSRRGNKKDRLPQVPSIKAELRKALETERHHPKRRAVDRAFDLADADMAAFGHRMFNIGGCDGFLISRLNSELPLDDETLSLIQEALA